MTVKNLKIEYTHQRLFWLLAYAALGLSVIYIYFVNTIVFDVVGRERALERMSSLQSEVTTLESQYVRLSSGITLDLAYRLGFHDAPESLFAYTDKAWPLALSLASD